MTSSHTEVPRINTPSLVTEPIRNQSSWMNIWGSRKPWLDGNGIERAKSGFFLGYDIIYIYIYISKSKTLQWYIYLWCIDFILLVLWIFARLQKTALLQKTCSRGSFLPHCQLDLLQFLNLRCFALFWRIFAFFLRKFSLELVSHQSKQILFSVELG